MNSYHGTSVYRVSVLEDQRKQLTGANTIYKFLLPGAVCCCLRTCNVYILILMLGCMCVQKFYNSGYLLYLVYFNGLYHNVGLGAIFFLFTNKLNRSCTLGHGFQP